MEPSWWSSKSRKMSHWSALYVVNKFRIIVILLFSRCLVLGLRFLCHSRRNRFFEVISCLMSSGNTDEFLRLGVYTLASIACWLFLVRHSMARSIDCLSLVSRVVMKRPLKNSEGKRG